MKKLIGKKEMEDALKRLDKLTQDEARMAAAENLRLTHVIDNKVTSLINGTSGVFSTWDLNLNTDMLFSRKRNETSSPTIGEQH